MTLSPFRNTALLHVERARNLARRRWASVIHCSKRGTPAANQNRWSQAYFQAGGPGPDGEPTSSSETPYLDPGEPCRAHRRASSTRRIRITRTPDGGSASPVQITVRIPAAAAAARRNPWPGGGRTAPVRLTSPANAERGGGATPAAEEARAAATARSAPGSSTRIPPAAAPYSSARDSRSPVARSTTAATRPNLRGSRPETWRRGGPSVRTLSAWTSRARAPRPAAPHA